MGELENQPKMCEVHCVDIRGMLQLGPVIKKKKKKKGIFRILIWTQYTELAEVVGLELRVLDGKLLQ